MVPSPFLQRKKDKVQEKTCDELCDKYSEENHIKGKGSAFQGRGGYHGNKLPKYLP